MWRYVSGVGAQQVNCGATWSAFLRSPIAVFFGGLDRFPKQRFASPAEYWNAMAFNLISIGTRTCIVRYEDVLDDPEGTCLRIEDALALNRRTERFVRVGSRTMNMADRKRSRLDDYTTSEAFDLDYYLQRRYLDEFNPLDRWLVRRQLDRDVVEILDYDLRVSGGRSDPPVRLSF